LIAIGITYFFLNICKNPITAKKESEDVFKKYEIFAH